MFIKISSNPSNTEIRMIQCRLYIPVVLLSIECNGVSAWLWLPSMKVALSIIVIPSALLNGVAWL
jgi:hypothetical protein